MLNISRQLAKQLRSVFRRALQITVSHADHIVWLQSDATGLRIRAQNHHAIVEFHQPAPAAMTEAVPITMEALAACEGAKSEETITIDRRPDETVVLRWEDRSVPQTFQVDAKKVRVDPPAAFPENWSSNPPQLLNAISDAMKILSPDASRYATNCVQLRPRDGRIAATDSRQLLIQTGFEFPGEGDLLVPRTTVFGCRELDADQPIEVGVAANHCVFRTGPWTIWLPLDKQGRYPRVEDIIPTTSAAQTRVSLAAEDLAFLLDVVPRLPEETEHVGRVTLDCNGSVALLAKGDGVSSVTQVVLRNSRRDGNEVRLNTDRQYLVRAAQLGFRELEIHAAESPLVCRDDRRVYLWAPLLEMPVLTAGTDAVQIASTLKTTTSHRATRHIPPPRRSRPTPERTTRMSHNRIAATLTGSATPTVNGSAQHVAEPNEPADQSTSFATVLCEAEAVKASLRDAHGQVSRLIAALKRHRRQSKLMQSTLASLKQLQTLEV